ncbi:hypothetical protein KGQ71_01905, partial [Patescibacteria group bacterium]|nr:hypothetical protein [Patescibacteria group bacterium]
LLPPLSVEEGVVTDNMNISTYDDTLVYLRQFIPPPGWMERKGYIRDRAFFLLDQLGAPQEKIPVIHLAGTSGKGSTAYLISHLLIAHGQKVGLHLSPHLFDIRERLQINERWIPEDRFVRLVADLMPAIKKTEAAGHGQPTLFEILTALAYRYFAEEAVDFAVMETGLGGLHDATNTVRRSDKIAVITRIGFDHTEILGHTLAEIAEQKAGIILPGNPVISSPQESEAAHVIQKAAREAGSEPIFIQPNTNYTALTLTPTSSRFNFTDGNVNLPDLNLSMTGNHQIENASVALAALSAISRQDRLTIQEDAVRAALSTAHFPGRFDIYQTAQRIIILDAAHNPQKIARLTETLVTLYPGQTFDFLLAFKKNKDVKQCLSTLVPLARQIYLTAFDMTQEQTARSYPPSELADILDELGFHRHRQVDDLYADLPNLANSASVPLVITGSIFLLSLIYPRLTLLSPSKQLPDNKHEANRKRGGDQHSQNGVMRPKVDNLAGNRQGNNIK